MDALSLPLTRMLVVAMPCESLGGNVKSTDVVTSAPVGGYLVIEETILGRWRFSGGSIW